MVCIGPAHFIAQPLAPVIEDAFMVCVEQRVHGRVDIGILRLFAIAQLVEDELQIVRYGPAIIAT